ncbi:ABC transporter ATP-binding protein [Rhizobium sp. 18055]|uniref:ABC transporter ATP-binding protein n=1 Tax=Rhizobium sp. 18055 TaxID=2681403 RepID=UPI0013574855|nr:ABC transporter ATP-binding protein [Rhizobium sp. 18055]
MTSETNAIEVESLSKSYVISHQAKRQARSLRELLSAKVKRQSIDEEAAETQSSQETFWALKDVSFNIGQGERIGIIGGNGAGKSTLLKILSRITEPTAGKVTIRGKVSSLLEVGTGFHPELTGRENVYLNGAILGMRRSEITAKFDRIVDFAGVEKFIDTPVKHYSSGMYVRLAFSVSAWLDPDILIVDEVLSVGDQAFQRRCAERMKELTGDGRTVLFVSHSMQAVRSMCEKALFLERGRAVSFGSVENAANQYLHSIDPQDGADWHKYRFSPSTDKVNQHGFDDEYIECVSASIGNEFDIINKKMDINKKYTIVLQYNVLKDMPFPAVPNFHFFDEFGERVCVSYPGGAAPNQQGTYRIECELPPYLFNTGRYSVMLIMSTFSGGLEYMHHFAYEAALRFEVAEPEGADERRHGWCGPVPGVTRPRLNWSYSN